jgi:S-DNA-T family DNA segregation ATPase FtsK/SpoIIIE
MGENLLALWHTLVIVWQTIVLLGVMVRRYPIRTALVGLFAGSCVLLGPRLTVGVMFYVPILLVLWYVAGRVLAVMPGWQKPLTAYRWLIGQRAYNAWRRRKVYAGKWQETLQGLHLTTVVDNGYDKVPELRSVTASRFGDVLRVKILPSQHIRDYVGLNGDTTRALAKTFGARECRVYDEPQSPYVRMELPRGRDPLADAIPFPGVPQSVDDVDLRAIPIGIDDHGRQVTVPILGSGLLIAGITGSGKGSVLWSIILHLVPHIRAGSVRIWMIDPKRGVEFNLGRNLAWKYCDTDPDDMAVILKEAVTIMDDKADWLKSQGLRKLEPTPEHPLDVVFNDELARLSDTKCVDPISTLVSVGRANGVSFVGALQNPTKKTAAMRDEIPAKVVLRMESRDYVRMTLGGEAYLNGARCDEIPASMPGCGYLTIDETKTDDPDERSWIRRRLRPRRERSVLAGAKEPRRFRAYWVDDELIKSVNASFAPEPAPATDQPTPEPAAA